jgi:hypothetical protein
LYPETQLADTETAENSFFRSNNRKTVRKNFTQSRKVEKAQRSKVCEIVWRRKARTFGWPNGADAPER